MEMEGKKNSPVEAAYERWTGFVARIFSGMTVKERFLAVAGLALTAVTAYFAAEKGMPFLPDGAGGGLSRPLGDALLCASGWTAPAAALGLFYSAYKQGEGVFARITALLLLFILRTAVSVTFGDDKRKTMGIYRVKRVVYRERATVKIAESAAFSLLVTGLRLPSVAITEETLPEILSMLFLTPVLTALLCGAFDGKSVFDAVNHRVIYSVYKEISLFAASALAVRCFKGYVFMGSSLAAIAAIFLTVATAVKGGAVRGGVMGVALGFSLSADYAPVLTAMGIVSGILSGLGITSAVGLSCVVGCVIAIYAYGYRAVLTYIPEGIIGAALTSPVVRYGFIGDGFPIPRKRIRGADTAAADADTVEVGARITALGDLAQAFERLSEGEALNARLREIPEAATVCRRLKNGFCDSCPMVCICWDESENGNKNAFNAVKRHISEIYDGKNGVVSEERRDTRAFRCLRSEELDRELIRLCDALGARGASAAPALGFFGDCRYISELLAELSERESEREYDAATTVKLKKAVASLGITAESAAVFGKRLKNAVIYGVNADWGAAFDGKMNRIAAAISDRCGGRFVPSSDGEDGAFRSSGAAYDGRGKSKLVFVSLPPLTADSFYAQKKASGEEENGDCAVCLETDGGYFHSVICDGMGSGAQAAKCSENAVNTLKTLLRCQISPALSTKLTGDFVKDGFDECFTTLDLLTVDMVTGEASLIKCGAADSYLLRNGEVKRLSMPSLPLGLSYGAAPEKIKLWLREGDTVVMVSDGLVEEEADESRLAERLLRLSNTADISPEDTAKMLISEAYDDGDVTRRRDDMTAIVIRITAR